MSARVLVLLLVKMVKIFLFIIALFEAKVVVAYLTGKLLNFQLLIAIMMLSCYPI